MPKQQNKNLIIAVGVVGAILVVILIAVLVKRRSPPPSPPPESMAVQVEAPPAPPRPSAKPPTLVLFYADGCGHCTAFKPTWDQLAPELESHGVKCLKLDHKDHAELMRQEGVAGFPTIKFYPHGFPGQRVDYNGPRTKEDIINFLQNGPQ